MKRLICLFLVLTFVFCLMGCVKQEEQLENPVRFYYPRKNTTYGSTDSVITWEEQEAGDHKDDYLYLLRQYIKGPQSDTLSDTFSRRVTVKDLQIYDDTAYVLLNSYAALLTGFELTMACACLTATLCEMTGVIHVTIQAEDALLDGNVSITMDQSQILLLDENIDSNAD